MAGRKPQSDIEILERLPDWRSLVGTSSCLSAWSDLIRQARMPQVMILDGREGCGKRAMLAGLVAMHFCVDGTACGTCGGCRDVLSGTNPDILWMDSKDGKFRIDDAELIQEHLSYSPGEGSKNRIVIVADADRLMVQAANRLLKTIEEPPVWARIYMSTSRLEAMLPTVLSRCVRWKISPPPPQVSIEFLRGSFERSGRDVPSDDDLFDLLKRSGLTPGKALHRAGLELGQEFPAGLGDRLAHLLAATTAYGAVEAAAAVVDGSGTGLAELLEELEIEINNQYWQAFHQKRQPDLVKMRRRRNLLKEIRRLVVKNKIALNAQMVFESIGFPGTHC